MAISLKGIRYIYYNQDFMKEITSRTNYWSNMSILAHEVGHHINGLTIAVFLAINEFVEEESLAAVERWNLKPMNFLVCTCKIRSNFRRSISSNIYGFF